MADGEKRQIIVSELNAILAAANERNAAVLEVQMLRIVLTEALVQLEALTHTEKKLFTPDALVNDGHRYDLVAIRDPAAGGVNWQAKAPTGLILPPN